MYEGLAPMGSAGAGFKEHAKARTWNPRQKLDDRLDVGATGGHNHGRQVRSGKPVTITRF